MSLNSSVPESASGAVNSADFSGPNYIGLVHFLLKPFLEVPESLKVDCERSANNSRVWIRVAFEGADKGRVFGRGGRNIQAIRTAIAAAGEAAGQSVYLDVYGGSTDPDDREGQGDKALPRKPPSRRPSAAKPSSRPRSR